MAGAKLISTRLAVCSACGSPGRLVAATATEIVSRCYACGDTATTTTGTAEIPGVVAAAAAPRLEVLAGSEA